LWQTINLKLIAPSALTALVGIASTLKSDLAPIVGSNFPPTFGGILGGLISILNTIKVLIVEKNDLTATITNTFITQTENIVNDVFNTGVSILLVLPKAGDFLLSPSKAISEAVVSLNDLGDPNRPILSSTSFAAGLGVLISAPTLTSFNNILSTFRQLISTKEIESLVMKVAKQVDILNLPKSPVRLPIPTPPLWFGIKIKDLLPAFQTAYTAVNNFLLELQGSSTLVSTSFDNLVTILTAKYTELFSIMNQAITEIDAIINLPTLAGIYVLSFSGIGGNSLIQNQLQSLKLASLSGNPYSAFVLMAGGSTSATAFETLAEIFGV